MSARSTADPVLILGYYPYIRDGVASPPRQILQEIPQCLALNPWYRRRAVFLAADAASARFLEGFGLTVTRTFEDAPPAVWRDTAHKMKHWMSLWALRTYGEYLWLDWDTVAVREPDATFWAACRAHGTPKFLRIPGYRHAVVNCGIVYAPATWADAMEHSFHRGGTATNDEHLWETILPPDVVECPEFWFNGHAAHLAGPSALAGITPELVLAHVPALELAEPLRRAYAALPQEFAACPA